ncbi:predicted protein [Sclerotinia sclerotiorum 1980 UF-70]|uniref:Uncharacterized protein n=1 Tax=Sclerotinia sclerotiorum (strain ATCC 18683 / 1980 / Ss-1) TaxID=665079 RepID=A7ENA4_SCLS1|nr:predicted protein [Sclerotinia sclerotiorum 1980 UF-70]EDO04320.1 predicted protein [Sclerotinia sclerotiorum 1980 UF-70]
MVHQDMEPLDGTVSKHAYGWNEKNTRTEGSLAYYPRPNIVNESDMYALGPVVLY